jgi:hopanoid biosynthesis associated RND transporter like protein HpnN
MKGAAETIGEWLARWVTWVVRRPRSVATAMILAGGLGAYYAAGHLGVNTDTANMISASLPWRQDFNDYRDTFPARDSNLLVVIDAKSSTAADRFAERMLGELGAEPGLYRALLLPGAGEFFERNGLLYLSVDELRALVDRLAETQPLLGLLESHFDGTAVLEVAARTARESNSSGQAEALAPFYSALAASLAAAEAGEPAELDWRRLLGVEESRPRRIIALQPALDFTTLQPAKEALAGIRAAALRVNAEMREPARVRVTGSVAMEHEELQSVSRGAEIGALATILMVAGVLYAALRSFRLLAISLLTLMVGLALTAAFAGAAVGHLNLLSVAFVVLNVGLGSDYVIHVLLRHKELVAQGVLARDALRETMRGVGASLVLCSVTTAAGFYSFIPTSFSGVSELGLIAGTGVFFGLFVSLTLLPALVVLAGESRGVQARGLIDARFFAPLNRRPRLVLGATAITLVAAAAALPAVRFDSNPIHLRDPESESVSTLLELATDGDAPLLDLVALAPSADTAREWATSLRRRPDVRRVVTVDDLVPANQDEKLGLIEDLSLLLGPGFGELAAYPADPRALLATLGEVDAETTDLTVARGLHDASSALRRRLESLPESQQDSALVALDEALTASLPRELARLAAGLDARHVDRESLPDGLRQRWLAADGRELVQITSADDVNDNAAARRFIASVKSVVPHATGLPVVYQEASATVVGAFERALVYAFVMVSLIIFVVLRNAKDTLLVLVPIVLAAIVTAGLTVAIGMPFNYANIIALPLLVGIGVDNGIHVVHRIKTETATQLFDTSTMRAVLASGLTTVASFGNLAFSAHTGTASMGVLLALGLCVSMAATLIVLPAWLRVADRRVAA